MSVPYTRTLPYVLREALAEPSGVRFLVGTVVSIPNAQHLVVSVQGQNITVPRLRSYSTAAAGDPVFLLVSPALILAIGSVK